MSYTPISGDLISIDGYSLAGMLKPETGASLGKNKLWKDAERNMNGDLRASLIGIFPKIMLEFRDALTVEQVSALEAKLDKEYYDPKRGYVTKQFYASDYELPVLDKSRGLYASFTVSLVATTKE